MGYNPWPDRLRALRAQLGFTQKELAAVMQVHPSTLAHWEQNSRVPEGPARTLTTLFERWPCAVKKLAQNHGRD